MHHQNPDTYNSSEDSRREGSKEHNSAQVENEHRNRHVMYVRERNGIVSIMMSVCGRAIPAIKGK